MNIQNPIKNNDGSGSGGGWIDISGYLKTLAAFLDPKTTNNSSENNATTDAQNQQARNASKDKNEHNEAQEKALGKKAKQEQEKEPEGREIKRSFLSRLIAPATIVEDITAAIIKIKAYAFELAGSSGKGMAGAFAFADEVAKDASANKSPSDIVHAASLGMKGLKEIADLNKDMKRAIAQVEGRSQIGGMQYVSEMSLGYISPANVGSSAKTPAKGPDMQASARMQTA